MTTQDKIYSLAEQNIYQFNDPGEKEILLEKDHTKTKEMIIHFRQRAKDLHVNISKIQEEYKGKRKHYNEDLVNGEREVGDIKVGILEYLEKISTAKREHEDKMQDMNRTLTMQKERRHEELKEELDTLIQENTNLKQKKAALNDFEKQQPALEAENQQLKQELNTEKTALKKYEQHIQEKKQKLIESLKNNYEAIENMKTDIKTLEKNTRNGKVDFAYQKKKIYLEVDKNRKENTQLMDQRNKIKMEKIVSNDCLTEYQNLNYKQAKRIKNLKTEVQYIKYRLSEELYRFASQLELLKKERAEMERGIKQDIDNLGSHISLKTNEVNNLRFLSRCVITQKIEMDKFFLETIEYLKNTGQRTNGGFGSQKNLKRSSKNVGSQYPYIKHNQLFWGTSSSSLPPLFPKVQQSQNETDANGVPSRVDLSDLTNPEKQKIIRILYSKINLGVTPGYWKEIERMVERREMELMEDNDFNGEEEQHFENDHDLDEDRIQKLNQQYWGLSEQQRN